VPQVVVFSNVILKIYASFLTYLCHFVQELYTRNTIWNCSDGNPWAFVGISFIA